MKVINYNLTSLLKKIMLLISDPVFYFERAVRHSWSSSHTDCYEIDIGVVQISNIRGVFLDIDYEI